MTAEEQLREARRRELDLREALAENQAENERLTAGIEEAVALLERSACRIRLLAALAASPAATEEAAFRKREESPQAHFDERARR
jgi:predicted nuclease with TOPRIM domain